MSLEPSFPRDLPQALSARAYVSGSEAAWRLPDALAVIDWCAAHGIAVAGTELWLVKDNRVQCGIETTTGLRSYEYDTEPLAQESWQDFHSRSVREAREHLQHFSWPADAIEPEQVPYFYLVLIDELWVQQYLAF
jgi:hypothetical protein